MPRYDYTKRGPESRMGGTSMAKTGTFVSGYGPGGPSMATQTMGPTMAGPRGGGGGKPTMVGRLKPPEGFNFKPYRICCMLPHYCLILLFVLALCIGFTLILGAILGAVFGYYILAWFAGGMLKLLGAGFCIGVLLRPNRCWVLVYLTETIMELLLSFLGLICVAMLIAVDMDQLRWRTDKTSAWFSSRTIKTQLRQIATNLSLDSTLLIGLSFFPMALFVLLLIVRICVLYRFIKYVEDRNEFLVRKGDATAAVSDQTVIPAPQTTAVTNATAMTKDDGLSKRADASQTLPRTRDETWKASVVKNYQKKSPMSGPKSGPATGPTGGKTPPPPSASKLVALADKKWQLKEAFRK